MDFFQHQERARRKTGLLVLYFILAVVAVVLCVNLALLLLFVWTDMEAPPAQQWFSHPITLWISLFTLVVMVCGCLAKTWQLRRGGEGLATMLGARRITPDTRHSDEKRLINVVEEMSIASGIPAPQLYVMDQESAINAFVAGFRPSETVLVVTSGTLKRLSRDELQGVIAHEFSHIFNADMRLNLRLIAVLAGILAIGKIGEFFLRGSRHSSSSRKGNSLLLVALALVVIGYLGLFFGRLIKAAISRQRELLADASAVQFTRNPAGLAGALIKIRNGDGSHLKSVHAEDMSHMCFGETLRFRFRRLLATHPPLDERLGALGEDWVARARVRARADAPQPDTTSASPPLPEGAAGFSAETATPAADAPRPSAQVGRVDEANVGYARTLLDALPADINRTLHDPAGAELALYALVISSSDSEPDELLKSLPNHPKKAALTDLSRQLGKLGSRLRLPVIDLALPTLKSLPTPQRRAILANLDALTRADEKTTLFEWALTGLAHQQLGDRAQRNRHTRFHRYGTVAGELQVLFSVLTWGSGARDQAANELFRRSTHGLIPANRTLLPLTHCSSKRLGEAVDKLADLSPLLKGPVLDAMADLAMADGKIQVTEAELLRTVASLMECPLPPLFAGTYQ